MTNFSFTRFLMLLVTITVVLASLFVGLGVAQESAENTESPVVFVRTGVEADAIRAVAESYAEKTGIPVEIMELGRAGFYSAVHTQLIGKTQEFDLAQANDVDVAVLAASGAIAPIEEYIYDPDLTDLEQYDLEDLAFVYRFNDEIYAVPFDISTHFLYYRSDLIPEPPQTWDEYIEIAKKWSRSQNPDSPTIYGASFTALAGSEQPKVFYSVMWSYGGWIVDDGGNVGIDSPGVIEAARFYRTLINEKLLPLDIYSWGFSEVMDALSTGMTAMAGPYWNAAYPMIKTSDSPYAEHIKLALVPGVKQSDGSIYRTPFQQGKVLLLNANSPRKVAAWKFLKYLTGKEGMTIMAEAGGTPSRFSILSSPEMEPMEYYDMMVKSLEIAKGDPGPIFYPEQHEAMNQALSDIVTGTEEAKTALSRAADIIRRLWKEHY